MPRRGQPPVSPTVDRLAARAEGGALRRRPVEGGEVFTGDLATRALKALGARAMTVDQAIVVPDAFDPSRAEDAALFAHEQYHLRHSGGEGAHDAHDAEEIAARAVERMVLHTASGGVDGPGGGAATGGSGGAASASASSGTGASTAQGGPDPGRGLAVLGARGLDREAIVRKLADQVLRDLDRAREHAHERHATKKGFV